MRTIKSTIVIFLCSLCAFLAGVRYQDGGANRDCLKKVRALTEATEKGAKFKWGDAGTLKDLRVQGPVSNWDDLAAALNKIGTLESLSVDQGSPAEIDHFLNSIVAPQVQMLAILDVRLSDHGIAGLANFPAVMQVQIVPSTTSGESFPALSKLESLDLSYAPVSDAGLVKILSCPKLHSLWLKDTKISMKGLLEALDKRHPALKKMIIAGSRIPEAEIANVHAKAKFTAPNVELSLSTGEER